MYPKIEVLDHGYVQLIETWGSDERIIEAARMSTGKGFIGWSDNNPCQKYPGEESACERGVVGCVARHTGDEKLLRYLYDNHHSTPFEMAGMVIEVKAPIFVFREWHRHRTQSYNEMSARYIPLPHENYYPADELVALRSGANANRQAAGSRVCSLEDVRAWLNELRQLYDRAESVYQYGLELGIPKELARLGVPVARYSRMRASANLRNWLAFLALRMDERAQWEIRCYASTVGELISQSFPRTWELFTSAMHRS